MPDCYLLPHPTLAERTPTDLAQRLQSIRADPYPFDSMRQALQPIRTKYPRTVRIGLQRLTLSSGNPIRMEFLPLQTLKFYDIDQWLLDAPFWSTPIAQRIRALHQMDQSGVEVKEFLKPIPDLLQDLDSWQGIEPGAHQVPAVLEIRRFAPGILVFQPAYETSGLLHYRLIRSMRFLIPPSDPAQASGGGFNPNHYYPRTQFPSTDEWFAIYRLLGILIHEVPVRETFLNLPIDTQIELLKEPVPYQESRIYQLTHQVFRDNPQ